MKKFIILLLAVLMVVGLCVSCKEDPKVAPEETVEDVVESTIDTFYLFGEYVYKLAYYEMDPTTVKAQMDEGIEDALEAEFEVPFSVQSVVTTTSINADIADASNIKTLKVDISSLEYNETTESITGNFAVKATGREDGATITYDVSGKFDITFEKQGASTITYSSVKYCGTSYDIAAFNEAMKEALKDFPPTPTT